MATFKMPTKDPNARLDYTVNLAAEIGSDNLSTVEWTVPTGISKTFEDHTDKTATIWLEGGTDGEQYSINLKYTTVAGRIDERTFIVPVGDR